MRDDEPVGQQPFEKMIVYLDSGEHVHLVRRGVAWTAKFQVVLNERDFGLSEVVVVPAVLGAPLLVGIRTVEFSGVLPVGIVTSLQEDSYGLERCHEHSPRPMGGGHGGPTLGLPPGPS